MVTKMEKQKNKKIKKQKNNEQHKQKNKKTHTQKTTFLNIGRVGGWETKLDRGD